MKIIGVTADGVDAFTAALDHGLDPGVLAYEQGFVVERPLSAAQDDLELVLRLAVRPLAGEPPPVILPVQADPGLVIEDGTLPVSPAAGGRVRGGPFQPRAAGDRVLRAHGRRGAVGHARRRAGRS